MPLMVSTSRKTLMLVSFLVIVCVFAFVIFKRRKREKRRRKGHVNRKRRNLADRLLKLFTFSKTRKNENGNTRQRNGVGTCNYSQIPTTTNSHLDSYTMGLLEDLEESDSDEEYEYEVGTRNSNSRGVHNIYINDENEGNNADDDCKLLPSNHSTHA